MDNNEDMHLGLVHVMSGPSHVCPCFRKHGGDGVDMRLLEAALAKQMTSQPTIELKKDPSEAKQFQYHQLNFPSVHIHVIICVDASRVFI